MAKGENTNINSAPLFSGEIITIAKAINKA